MEPTKNSNSPPPFPHRRFPRGFYGCPHESWRWIPSDNGWEIRPPPEGYSHRCKENFTWYGEGWVNYTDGSSIKAARQ